MLYWISVTNHQQTDWRTTNYDSPAAVSTAQIFGIAIRKRGLGGETISRSVTNYKLVKMQP